MSTSELIETAPKGGLITAELMQDVKNLAVISTHVVREIKTTKDSTEQAFVVAAGLEAIHNAITPELMKKVMWLKDNPLGFRTDRPPGTFKDGKEVPEYSANQVKPILVQALVRGLRMTGNEWNIIAKNLYVAKEGVKRLVQTYPGITDLDVSQPKIPKTGAGGAVVEMSATWKLDGKADKLECHGDYAIPIRVNAGMGAQAIQGKAIRQFYNRLWERLICCDAMKMDTGDIDNQGWQDVDIAPEPVAAIAQGPPTVAELLTHAVRECEDAKAVNLVKKQAADAFNNDNISAEELDALDELIKDKLHAMKRQK